jgi:hypothetical protein
MKVGLVPSIFVLIMSVSHVMSWSILLLKDGTYVVQYQTWDELFHLSDGNPAPTIEELRAQGYTIPVKEEPKADEAGTSDLSSFLLLLPVLKTINSSASGGQTQS